MKTVIIAHNYTKQTVAAMSYKVAHYLADNNYKVVFISHKPFFENKFIDNNVIVYSWPTSGRPTGFKDALWFAKIVLNYKADFVISHFGSVNITVIISKIVTFWNVKTFPYYHTLSTQLSIDSKGLTYFAKFKKIRKYLVYKFFCDKIICPSEFSKNDLAQYFNLKKGIKILNPMIDRSSSDGSATDCTGITLSYLGRINESKGIYLLISAFNSYCKRNKKTKIKLNIAGSVINEAEFNNLIKSNLNISYKGALSYDKIDDFIRNGTYTIIPSYSDNLPTVGLESLMNGIPIIISENTGLTQELAGNVNCLKFAPTNEELLLLFENLDSDAFDYRMLKNNSRKIYLEKFGMESYCKRILELVEN